MDDLDVYKTLNKKINNSFEQLPQHSYFSNNKPLSNFERRILKKI